MPGRTASTSPCTSATGSVPAWHRRICSPSWPTRPDAMASRSEYDAAYFTLLRAREEHAQLLSYLEYLSGERERLDSFVTQLREQAHHMPRRMRRTLDYTTKAVVEAVGARRSVVLAELERMDDRIRNAAEFVEECETEVTNLRN